MITAAAHQASGAWTLLIWLCIAAFLALMARALLVLFSRKD